jgi:hypothetical protein
MHIAWCTRIHGIFSGQKITDLARATDPLPFLLWVYYAS